MYTYSMHTQLINIPSVSFRFIGPLSNIFKDRKVNDLWVSNNSYYSIDSSDSLSDSSIYIPNFVYILVKNEPRFKNLRNFLILLSYFILSLMDCADNPNGAICYTIYYNICYALAYFSF